MKSENVESVQWSFFGVQFANGTRPVQDWFSALSEEERDEISDTLSYLQVLPHHLWHRPEFCLLGGSLSEIRCKVSSLNKALRIYGFFYPSNRRHCYTLLAGREKKESNDKKGKSEAEGRMRRIEKGEASVHEFRFTEGLDRQTSPR